jgi:hypothetical protein
VCEAQTVVRVRPTVTRLKLTDFRFTRYRLSPVFFFYMALQPNAGYGLLTHEVYEITHTHDAPHSAGLLWASDQSVAETST